MLYVFECVPFRVGCTVRYVLNGLLCCCCCCCCLRSARSLLACSFFPVLFPSIRCLCDDRGNGGGGWRCCCFCCLLLSANAHSPIHRYAHTVYSLCFAVCISHTNPNTLNGSLVCGMWLRKRFMLCVHDKQN